MKVLWLFNHPAPYKIDFFNELGKSVQLTVIFERTSEGDRNKEFYYEKAKNFKEIILSSWRLGDYNNYAPKLLSVLKDNPFDLIVVNGWSTLTEMKCIRYLKRHKIPYIFAINGGIARDNEAGWKRHLKQKYLSGAKLYLSPDPYSSTYLTHYGVEASKIRLYPYSTVFDSEVLKAPLSPNEKKSLRAKEGIEGEEFYLSVGQFIPRKNDDQLLKIWTAMPKSKTLYLVGSGPCQSDYLRLIKESNLSNVHLCPFKSHAEILHLFSLADASIFLTKEDIYGHVVNECLSQGTPVISSGNANSARNLIRDGYNGYLVSLEDEDKIKALLSSPLDPSLSLHALETSKTNTIEAMTSAHLMIFEEFLKS